MSGRTTSLLIAVTLLSGGGRRLAAVQDDAAGRRADLAAFRERFFDVDHSYPPAARAEAERRLKLLEQEIDRTSDVQFVTRLTQVVALADNGHTAMLYRGGSPELNRVPLRLLPFGNDFYVARAATHEADLVGGRLLAIDSHPIAQVRDSARTLSGGIPAWRDRSAPYLFESPGQLHAMGLARAGGGATYRFELPGGRVVERTLQPAGPLPGDGEDPITPLDPDVPAGVVSMLPVARAPWSLRDFGTLVRRRDAPELDAVVIQMHGNFNPPGGSIAVTRVGRLAPAGIASPQRDSRHAIQRRWQSAVDPAVHEFAAGPRRPRRAGIRADQPVDLFCRHLQHRIRKAGGRRASRAGGRSTG